MSGCLKFGLCHPLEHTVPADGSFRADSLVRFPIESMAVNIYTMMTQIIGCRGNRPGTFIVDELCELAQPIVTFWYGIKTREDNR